MVQKRIFPVVLAAVLFFAAGGIAAQEADTADGAVTSVDPNDPNEPAETVGGLFALSLDELMDIEVISVTRTKGQNVFTSPAAIYVITQEDIQRSGLRSLPEVLRLAPGVQVSRIRSDQWVISIRGFAERFADKLLVQIDGRTMYNQVFSGVLWEVQDYPLADIDRIEIIRGPGASLWGANAVHGIINIITKRSQDTQGGCFYGSGGDFESIGTLRYGGKAGDNGYWRVWGKQRYSENFPAFTGDFTDDYGLTTMGFRYDLDTGDCDRYTFEMGAFDGRYSTFFPIADVSAGTETVKDLREDQYGGHIRGAWDHQFSDTSMAKLQTYVNFNSFAIPDNRVDYRTDWNLFDIDFQHNFLMDENSIVWGLGYRRNHFTSRGSETISYIPSNRNIDFLSGFIQDTFPVFSDKLKGTLGVKLLDNDFTGFEYQPTARLAYQHNERNFFWAAYSRAIRTPNIANFDLFLNRQVIAPFTVVTVEGNKDYGSERVNSYEAGWRARVNEKLTLDVTGYVMNGDNMGDIGVFDPPLRYRFNNDVKANTEGIEVAVDWQASETWRLKGTYSWIHLDVYAGREGPEGLTPQNMFSVNSYKNLSEDIELNTNIFFNDRLKEGSEDVIDSWVRLDSGLVWHVNDDMRVGLWGQNLLDSGTRQFDPRGIINRGGSDVPRSVFIEMTYRF